MSVGKFNPESTECLICGSKNLAQYEADAFDATGDSYVNIVECEECTFAWQYPLGRTEDESVEFFQEAYKSKGEGQSNYFNPTRKRKIANLEFEFLTTLHVEGHSLLDVGAGAGLFAELAAENGWFVTAVDPALESDRIKNDPLLQKIKGKIDEISAGKRFDIITLWDVIEHISRPIEFLEKIQLHLQEGGWVVIETGNYKSASRLLDRKKHWIYQLDHRWYFSPESIQKILLDMGFTEFIFCEKVLRPDWNGTVECGNLFWDNLLESLNQDRHSISEHFSNSVYIANARKWEKSGLAIFTIAARKI